MGPQKDISAPLLIAEAAHITAASETGPRFNPSLSPAERRAVTNGIWLCATCHTMVDKDRHHYTDELLMSWKRSAEEVARKEVEGETIFTQFNEAGVFAEQYFESQLADYAPSHSELGKHPDSAQVTIPISWLQVAAVSSLKGLVNLLPDAMKTHLDDVHPVVGSGGQPSVSRFGVHVEGRSAIGTGSLRSSVVQMFHDGSIANGFVMYEHVGSECGFSYDKHKQIPWKAFEERLIRSVGQSLDILRRLGVPQIAFARLVVSRIVGYGVVTDPMREIRHRRCDTDIIKTAALEISDFSVPITEMARPLLERFWQHFGVWRSPSYNENGDFVGR